MENCKTFEAIRKKALSENWDVNINEKKYNTKNKKYYSIFFYKNNQGRGMSLEEEEVERANINNKILLKILNDVDKLLNE